MENSRRESNHPPSSPPHTAHTHKNFIDGLLLLQCSSYMLLRLPFLSCKLFFFYNSGKKTYTVIERVNRMNFTFTFNTKLYRFTSLLSKFTSISNKQQSILINEGHCHARGEAGGSQHMDCRFFPRLTLLLLHYTACCSGCSVVLRRI